MKRLLVCTLFALLGVGIAQAADAPAQAPTTSPATKPAPAINAFCLVETDHPVDPDVFIMYEGQKIGFCCTDCIEAFKANPEKYLAKLKK